MPLTEKQLETRLDWVEQQIAKETDTKQLAFWNQLFQKLLDKLVAIDLEKQDGR